MEVVGRLIGFSFSFKFLGLILRTIREFNFFGIQVVKQHFTT